MGFNPKDLYHCINDNRYNLDFKRIYGALQRTRNKRHSTTGGLNNGRR